MSELRDALNWLVHLHHGVSKGGDVIDEETGERVPIPVTDSEWRAALQAAEQALDAPSEMQQLVEWLEREKKDHEEWLDRKEAIYDTSTKLYQGSRAAYQETLDHIRTEFLWEGKDARSD